MCFFHKYAVIIPAYNESITIQKVICDFARVKPDAYIVVVNNASTDDTQEKACDVIKSQNINGEVINCPTKGKGYAVRHAFRTVQAEYYIMVDADDTYLADDLLNLLEPVEQGMYDCVIGDRLSNQMYQNTSTRQFHYIGNRGVSSLINMFFKSNIVDLFSGYRVFSWEFVKHFPIVSKGFELETEMTLHMLTNHYRICELPIQYQDRPEGSESKLNTFRDGFRVIRLMVSLIRLYYPLRFFSWMGFLFVSLGVFLGIPIIVDFIQTGLVPRVPTAIFVGMCEVIGFILIAVGIILDSIIKLNQRQTELWRLHFSLDSQKIQNTFEKQFIN